MYLAMKTYFPNDDINNFIMRQLGYNAYKLWNVANYEMRNWQILGMDRLYTIHISNGWQKRLHGRISNVNGGV